MNLSFTVLILGFVTWHVTNPFANGHPFDYLNVIRVIDSVGNFSRNFFQVFIHFIVNKRVEVRFSDNTEICWKFCKNISSKYDNIAKIFWKMWTILLIYCKNLTMSPQNIRYVIFGQNWWIVITQRLQKLLT